MKDASQYFSCGELIKPFCSDEEALQIVRALYEKETNSFAYQLQLEGFRQRKAFKEVLCEY
jgi:hypothetical protein